MGQAITVDFGDLGFAIYVTQAVANLVLLGVLLGLYRVYRRAFLFHWGASWAALLVYHLGAAYAAGYAMVLPPGHWARIVISSITVTAGYAQVALLISGTWLLVTGRSRIGRRELAWLFVLTVVLGVGSVLGSLELDPQVRLFVRVGLRSLFAGLSFLGAAFGVWRVTRREPSSGRWLTVGFFLLTGLAQLRYFGEQLQEQFVSEPDTVTTITVPHFVDLFLQLMVVLSMVVWFFEDDRRRLAQTSQALLRSEERLRHSERMEAVGRLAGGIAHDFNNLLTAISGHAELLLERAQPADPDREDLQPIVKASGRAAELVRELLAFSRRQPVQPRVFRVNEVLRDLHRMLARLMGENVRLVLELDPEDGAIRADPAQIELMLLNLATNARDAITGPGTLRIRISSVALAGGEEPLVRPGPYLLLEVSDDGCGIPPESLDKIFEPFFTTKSGKGTGLGLSSVYGIVKQNEGDIQVQSEPGQGTTFRIWLPRVVPPDEPSESPREERAETRGSEALLLVEDDPQVRELARRLLSNAGYGVIAAESGQDALEKLRAHDGRLDLIVTDVVMPGMGVREMVEAVRGRFPLVRVLMTSGYAESTVLRQDVEGSRFLAKPFTARGLLLAVREMLDGREPAGPRASRPSEGEAVARR